MLVRLVLALALLGSLSTLGCSGRKDPAAWIDASAAVVHCTTAGRTKMPPVLLGLPFPPPPTGLYARGMDPMALNDMGYERDRPVCAALLAPDDDAVKTAGVAMADLSARIASTSAAAIRSMPCACETAGALGMRDLVVGCAQVPTRKCGDSDQRRATLSAVLAPLVATIAETPVPRRHWRLVGPTDRPEWFAMRITSLLERHVGGSVVILPGQPVPARDNDRLLSALLQHPDVVAVARQDSGRAVTVARVVDGMQILDHFEQPPMDPALAPVRAYLDNARPSDLLEALNKPTQAWVPSLPLTDGNVAALDSSALERVDAMTVAQSPLLAQPYPSQSETRDEPETFVATIAVQSPFGTEGRALRVKVTLTDAGRMWATTLADARLGADLDPLALSGERPRFVPGEPSPPFLLRGTDTNALLVHGLHAMADVMHAMEIYRPGTVQGTTRAWDFALPQGALAHGGAMVPPPSLRGLADAVMNGDYRVTATVDEVKGTVVADIVPAG